MFPKEKRTGTAIPYAVPISLPSPLYSSIALVLVVFLCAFQARAQGMPQNCDRIVYGTELVDDVTYCASSVLPNSRVATYRPGNLPGWGDDVFRAWCEGAYGPGIGEWVQWHANPGTRIRKVIFHNGYQKSAKSFRENGRVRDMLIETDSGLRMSARLKDQSGSQTIWLGNWFDVSTIRVTVRSVYPGSKYEDLCLSGFVVDFEDIREWEFQQMQ